MPGPFEDIKIEIATFTLGAARDAAIFGADRIEFCKDYTSGGVSPALAELKAFRDGPGVHHFPLYVMIRVRPGKDFTISDKEYWDMKELMLKFRSIADGFVLGVLNKDGDIDREANTYFTKLARPTPCTFHRAFDHANGDLRSRLDTIRDCGFASVLTSGGEGDAITGVEQLRRTVDMACLRGIEVIVGGGVRASNIVELIEKTGARWYHTSAIHGSDLVPNVKLEVDMMRKAIKEAGDKAREFSPS